MALAKRSILRFVVLCEVIIFAGMYFTSSSGFKALRLLEKDNHVLGLLIHTMEDDIATLRLEIAEWDKDSWYKERMAREELQMAYQGEEVFLLD